MKIRRKNSKRKKLAQETSANVTPAPLPAEATPAQVETATGFTPNDLPPADNERQKRKYTRRNSSGDVQEIGFGKIMTFAGETLARLTTLITKTETPLSANETEMLSAVGSLCGKYVADETTIEEVAPKYAKYAIGGALALIVGVRAIDYFTRPRLTAGKSAQYVEPAGMEAVANAEYQG